MSRKNVGILVAVLVVILIFIIVFSSHKTPGGNSIFYQGQNQGASAPGPVTREAAPTNVTVPNANATSTPADVAVPQSVTPAHAGGSADLRVFSLRADGGAFTPNTVIIKKGDTVHINITAVDRAYDFTQPDYGFNAIKIAKGSTVDIPFDGTAAGKFTFYCSSCGGPTQGPVGYIIISN